MAQKKTKMRHFVLHKYDEFQMFLVLLHYLSAFICYCIHVVSVAMERENTMLCKCRRKETGNTLRSEAGIRDCQLTNPACVNRNKYMDVMEELK